MIKKIASLTSILLCVFLLSSCSSDGLFTICDGAISLVSKTNEIKMITEEQVENNKDEIDKKENINTSLDIKCVIASGFAVRMYGPYKNLPSDEIKTVDFNIEASGIDYERYTTFITMLLLSEDYNVRVFIYNADNKVIGTLQNDVVTGHFRANWPQDWSAENYIKNIYSQSVKYRDDIIKFANAQSTFFQDKRIRDLAE